MLNYSVREHLAYLQNVDNAIHNLRLVMQQDIPTSGQNEHERALWRRVVEIEQAVESMRTEAKLLAIDHGQADIVWKD